MRGLPQHPKLSAEEELRVAHTIWLESMPLTPSQTMRTRATFS